MIPPQPWYAPFDRGYEALLAERYEEALIEFDKAVALGGEVVRVFSSRQEVLENIRAMELSLLDLDASGRAQANVDFDLEKNSQRLFRTLSRLPLILRAPLLRIDNGKFFDPVSSWKAASLYFPHVQAVRTRLRSTTRNVVDYLPAEILSSIAHHIVDTSLSEPIVDVESSRSAVDLSSVSRRWRSIFLEDKGLWGKVYFRGGDRWKEELEFFASRGPLTDIELGRGDEYIRPFVEHLRGKGASLRRLVIPEAMQSTLDDIWRIWETPARSLRTLGISWRAETLLHLPLPPTLDHIASLTSLQLAGIYPSLDIFASGLNLTHTHSLQPLLAYLPKLQTLDLFGPNLTLGPYVPSILDEGKPNPFPFPMGEPVEVPNLKELISNFDGSGSQVNELPPSYTPGFLLPKLESLNLMSKTYLPFLFPSSLPLIPNEPNINTTHLKTLELTSPFAFDPLLFATHLQHMPSLSNLAINLHRTSPLDGIVDALAAPPEEGKKMFLCPELDSISFLESNVGGKSLRGLIASRAAPESSWRIEQKPEGRKLGTVDIRGATGVFLSEDENWLRFRLAYFTGRDDSVQTGSTYRRIRGDV